jgi:SAM-dependent methyltransferase
LLNSDCLNKDYAVLVEKTALRFSSSGRFEQGFVRGKLLHDPVYREILDRNILPNQGKILDLGCGRGILLALLTTLRHSNSALDSQLEYQGFELSEKTAQIARNTLGMDADIVNADVRSKDLPDCQAVLLLDVLMYMPNEDQEALLQKLSRVLQPNGVLIVREADAGSGLPFVITWLAERVCALARGHWRQRYGYRSKQEWNRLLEQLGFKVEMSPMSQGTPFANVLFVARQG